MKHFVLFFVGALCFSSALKANDVTGRTLLEMCLSDEKTARTICQMWINGFHNGVFAAQAVTKSNQVPCLKGTTGGQARVVIVKFMRDFPTLLEQPVHVVAFLALQRAFPCKAN